MMRICLLSTTYPPANNEGISRQRHALAHELTNMGHEVHVVTCGETKNTRTENKVIIHEIPIESSPICENKPISNMCINTSQALYRGLAELLESTRIDIIDVPLWAAQGFVTLERCSNIPVVTWLQTTTAQMLEINHTHPSDDQKRLLSLEKRCISLSAGILGDSRAVIKSVTSHYGIPESTPSGIAYIGTPACLDRTPKEQKNNTCIEALIVGRLEKRKGTPIMFNIIPLLLQNHPELKIRFVGRDNSASDGWQDEHNLTYPGYFNKHHSSFSDRVVFEGYVEDETLQKHYQNADMLIVPSTFESFGIIYLEAMRMGIPVVTLKNGGSEEIFPAGKKDGALLSDDDKTLSEDIETLTASKELRYELGENGLENFNRNFTAAHMTKATLQFYEQVIKQHTTPIETDKVFQVMEHVSDFDGVSKIVRDHSERMNTRGQSLSILCETAPASIQDETLPMDHILNNSDSSLIYHYWNYKPSTWILHASRARKALYYHNITPAHFFKENIYLQHTSQMGFRQLAQIADYFDLIIGDSQYNINELAEFITVPKPSIHIYPVIEENIKTDNPYDHTLVRNIKKDGDTVNFLFVGRITQNKRIEKIIAVFDYYFRHINSNSKLWLVGSEKFNYGYRRQLEELRLTLKSGNNIMFTSLVPDKSLYAYYHIADVFLCGSEHEGFGIPLIEAMAYDVPVIAYAAGAVPETMGAGGILVKDWDIPRIAELANLITTDKELLRKTLETQRTNLKRFSKKDSEKRMKTAIDFLLTGQESNMLREIQPGGIPA